jgi:hypothetical protein
MNHAYPLHLAEFVVSRWDHDVVATADYFQSMQDKFCLPPVAQLERILSTCYQASLLTEEHRPVTFRLILGAPECFPVDHGPPTGLHRLMFTEPRGFTAHELRRLSPAASFHRSLIGLDQTDDQTLNIWGVLHSGPRWLRALQGGRGSAPAMPPALVVNVSGAGHIEVCQGTQTIGQLSDGRVFGPSMNVFNSKWLAQQFEGVRADLMRAHKERRSKASTVWADLDPELIKFIGQHMIKRIFTSIRSFQHGGTVVIVPTDVGHTLLEKNPYISLKYKFADSEPRARYRTLMMNLMDGLAEYGGRQGPKDEVGVLSWADYETITESTLANLDEAVFEVSHLIAHLSSVDGCVLMTKKFELLGFGGEIFCESAEVKEVARAVDLEGSEVVLERVEGVGTRHRSAYRLCNALKGALAFVVSQDGSVRFVRWFNDHVTYWDHQATTSSFDF